MRTRHLLLAGLLMSFAAAGAQAACKERRNRDASFIELAVPEDAIRPTGAQDFAFVTDDTTYEQLIARVGPPDASQGDRVAQYIWCFADGTELAVYTRDRVVIEQIRHAGKQIYKRRKK